MTALEKGKKKEPRRKQKRNDFSKTFTTYETLNDPMASIPASSSDVETEAAPVQVDITKYIEKYLTEKRIIGTSKNWQL